MYIRKGALVTEQHYVRYVMLLKVLFRLGVIAETEVIDSIMEFNQLFV